LRKLRFLFFYFILIFARYKKRIVLAVFLILLLGFGIYSLNESFKKETISQGIVGTHTQDDLPGVVTQLLSQGLVKIGKDGQAEPNLVENWQVGNDGKLYTFKLRKDLSWIDGTLVSAKDISISIPDAQVSTPDDQTIEFKLVDSFSPFPTLLSRPVFKKNTNLGLGPYKIADIQKDIIFIKKITLKPIRQNLPEVIIKFYPNEKIAKTALKLGEVNSLLGVGDIDDLITQRPFSSFSQVTYSRIVTIFYNTADPVLSDENFRLALSYSAPSIKNEIEAKTSIPPTSWAFNPYVKDFLDNEEQALKSFKKVQNGKDTPIILTVTTPLKSIGEQVVEAWKKIGINAILRVESGLPQDFQALLISQKIPPDPDQYSLWHKLGQINISKLSSPRIDKDLEDGRKLQDLQQRKQKYADFQKVLHDSSPATFLYYPKYNVVFLKKKEETLKKILDMQLEYF